MKSKANIADKVATAKSTGWQGVVVAVDRDPDDHIHCVEWERVRPGFGAQPQRFVRLSDMQWDADLGCWRLKSR